jgi:hypothetical protein
MFGRDDRSIRRDQGPLIIVILIIGALAGGGLFLWSRAGRAPAPEQGAPQHEAGTAPAARPGEPLAMALFLPVNGMLEQVPASIERQPELQLEAREAAAAVLAGGRSGQTPVLRDLELRALYIDPAGTAYADLSAAGRTGIRSSAGDEFLAVYALVNTLMQNFADVRQVRLLVDGREAMTLAGHLDVSRAFVRRMDLVRNEAPERQRVR